MPIELFEDLRDGIIEPIEVLRNHAKFKLDLSEMEAASQ